MTKKKKSLWKLRLPDSHTHKVLLLAVILLVLYFLVSAVSGWGSGA